MLKNKKVLVAVVLVLLFVGYTMTKPKPHVAAKPKVAGQRST